MGYPNSSSENKNEVDDIQEQGAKRAFDIRASPIVDGELGNSRLANGYSDSAAVLQEQGPGVLELTGELNTGDAMVQEIVVPETDEDSSKKSELYVDTEDLEGADKKGRQPGILRLDPEDVEKIGNISSYEYHDAPAERLHVSSTLPSGTIDLILDEKQKDNGPFQSETPAQEAHAPGLVRTNSAPGVSCVDPKCDTYEDSHKRLAKEKEKSRKQPRISHHRRKKLMKRLGSITNEGAIEIDEERIKAFPDLYGESVHEEVTFEEDQEKKVPPLQIAMLIVGTRGDIQPFVAIGKELQKYGHRVRLATHGNFREFVKTAGLEFYPLGGDPKVLAGYMVKNKGFLPSGPKEIKTQRKQLKAIVYSLYPACTEPDQESRVPFRAEAIIANPPAYGHVHVAEALGVPIHIYFTMPWTPTSEFPHPLSRIKNLAANRLSYQVVDSMIWLGIRSLINDFRKKKLKLRPISYLSRNQGSITDLPTCYIWSPCVVPKPKDWGPRVDVVGYCFLTLADDYKPPEDLVKWLEAGSKPIYVGFGSLPVKDPKGMAEMIIKALEQTHQRGLIDKGWGGISDMPDSPDFVRFIDNCPHDWLFPQCAAVVHHGGAGTTAAGLKSACPTTIVPFFGDQPFWGERVHDRGIGPSPIPIDRFSLEKLVDAINFMLSPEVKERAVEMAKCIEQDDGVGNAVKVFHKHLPRVMPPAPPHPPSPTFCGTAFKQMCCY